MLPTRQELEQMKMVDIMTADRDELVDIRNVTIDTDKNVNNRVADYIEQVKNPFVVKVGDYVVKISFSETEETVNDRMKTYISKMAEIRY